MTFEEVLNEPSDRQKILDYLDELEYEYPYKVTVDHSAFVRYNEAWSDAIDRVRSFIESM